MAELDNSSWYKHLPFTKKPLIQHIEPEEVAGITDTTGDITDHTFITAMGLLRVGMDTLGSSATPAPDNNIRSRVNKMLKV